MCVLSVWCWLIRALGPRRIRPGRRLSLLRDRKPGGRVCLSVCVINWWQWEEPDVNKHSREARTHQWQLIFNQIEGDSVKLVKHLRTFHLLLCLQPIRRFISDRTTLHVSIKTHMNTHLIWSLYVASMLTVTIEKNTVRVNHRHCATTFVSVCLIPEITMTTIQFPHEGTGYLNRNRKQQSKNLMI